MTFIKLICKFLIENDMYKIKLDKIKTRKISPKNSLTKAHRNKKLYSRKVKELAPDLNLKIQNLL